MRILGVVFSIVVTIVILFAYTWLPERKALSASQGAVAAPAGTVTLTVVFDGLIVYAERPRPSAQDNQDVRRDAQHKHEVISGTQEVEDVRPDAQAKKDVWVLLVDAGKEDRSPGGKPMPIHVPMVTFRSSDGNPLNVGPWMLHGEDIHLGPDNNNASANVAQEVWDLTGPLKTLTGSELREDLFGKDASRTGLVARIKLSQDTLEVYDPGKLPVDTAFFSEITGDIHDPPRNEIALLMKYDVNVETDDADPFVIWTQEFGKSGRHREFKVTKDTFMYVGNVSIYDHGATLMDRDFSRFYDLMAGNVPLARRFVPVFAGRGIARRACMGGGG